MNNIKNLFDAINKEVEGEQICWRCSSFFVGKGLKEREYCASCHDSFLEEDNELMDKYLEMKTRIMWRRALNNLEKQNLDMDDYFNESQFVLELALSDYNKFRSSPEMMVAMELLRKGIKSYSEYRVLRYRVDFLLPDLKVVLEIDGRLHDFKVKKDSDRDVAILSELNKEESGWEILRIPTKYIEQNVKQLVPAIKELYKERQRLRRKHNGFLPTYYSRHDTAQQLKAFKSIDRKQNKEYAKTVEDRFEKEWKAKEL